MKNFDFAERSLTAIAMLAQHDASSLPKGGNSLSKRKPRNERKKNPKQAKKEEAVTLGRNIGKRYSEKKKRDL